jgi:probable F420-dependent oxidoreductase
MTATDTVSSVRNRLGRVGVWLLDVASAGATPADVERRQAARIEELGYGSLWIAEGLAGKEVFAHLGILLAATERLVIGAGIANLGAREPASMQMGALTLAEAYPGRFILGVGGATRAARMREYLDAMDAAMAHPMAPRFAGSGDVASALERLTRYLEGHAEPPPPATVPVPRVLAAMGPKMLEVARDRADGAHPFHSPVEHTRFAREVLGPDKLLIPEQAVVLDPDPTAARASARVYVDMGRRFAASPYLANLRRLGWSEEDIFHGDRLVDAVVAWGSDEAPIVARVVEQLEAGADHVLIHPLAPDLPSAVAQLERLAPALLELDGVVGP